jgi:hypothetical protein
MSNNSYFPTNEAEQIIWLTHYSTKLTINGRFSGIDAAEITRIQAAFVVIFLSFSNGILQLSGMPKSPPSLNCLC